VNGLKGEVKPFIMAFKPETLDVALEYGLYMESATESQYRRLKPTLKLNNSYSNTFAKNYVDKGSVVPVKPAASAPLPKPSLIDQRRALGQCFKCLKLQMLMGQSSREGLLTHSEAEHTKEELCLEDTEEAIVSMHATSSKPVYNTMKFKGVIGHVPVSALLDSGSTHSFVNPLVLHENTHQITSTNPMIVMVANGERMVTDSKCEALQFSIQGHDFQHDLRVLPVKGYDVILGLD
jgi:Retroviral aspartyl protease